MDVLNWTQSTDNGQQQSTNNYQQTTINNYTPSVLLMRMHRNKSTCWCSTIMTLHQQVGISGHRCEVQQWRRVTRTIVTKSNDSMKVVQLVSRHDATMRQRSHNRIIYWHLRFICVLPHRHYSPVSCVVALLSMLLSWLLSLLWRCLCNGVVVQLQTSVVLCKLARYLWQVSIVRVHCESISMLALTPVAGQPIGRHVTIVHLSLCNLIVNNRHSLASPWMVSFGVIFGASFSLYSCWRSFEDARITHYARGY